MTKVLLTGNEAVARGVYEAGGNIVVAYPGTPSTEITENAAKYDEVKAEWAPNEKVALEVGMGAGIAGGRALVAMKHVGLNVAADPLFTAAYTGTNGGVVVVSADDPGMHSSQNEQDNRCYGRAAKLPVIEPSDSTEAKEFTKMAFQISEDFDTPVILRMATRVCHSQSLVELCERENVPVKPYKKQAEKYVMVPAHARLRHVVVEERLKKLEEFSNETSMNKVEMGDTNIGIITSGVNYQYVKEVMPNASVLKLGFSFPLPEKLIREFASKVDKLVIVEELEPLIENGVKAMGIPCVGKEYFGNIGEIFAENIEEKLLGKEHIEIGEDKDVPKRPPVLCAGCPHRAVFHVLHQLHLNVSGDIGCYTLGCAAPLSAMDTALCMGYSISGLHGMEQAQGREFAKNSVAVIGDSTFIHSGITGLINSVYNGGTSTVMILDNRITAMTGHQDNPLTGKNAKGEPAPEVNLEQLVEACGVKRIRVVDPFNMRELRQILKEELEAEEVSVIISRRPCILINRKEIKPALHIDPEKCRNCGSCMRIGCPAIVQQKGFVSIDPTVCVGCDLCTQLCGFKAISKEEEN